MFYFVSLFWPSEPKAGFFIIDGPPVDASLTNSDVIDFSAASPDEDGLPYREYQRCLSKAVFHQRHKLFDYNDPQGLLSLRISLSRHLQNDQIFTKPDNIFVTSGSQQALFLLCAMPFPNGKTNVLVEQPCYHGMLRSLELLHVRTLGIERTEEGLNLEELERHFRGNSVKCFYTVPRFHNPTGLRYTKEQREGILDLASKYDVYIIEDDYLADAETDTKAEPIAAGKGSERVVYLRSFSKVMLPGLRLSLAVVPEKLVSAFAAFKHCSDLGTNSLSQNALEIYLDSGLYAFHTERMRELYSQRMRSLQAAFAGTIFCG